MTRLRSKAERSFTLIEVVLAVGIVSFSVLATIGLLSVATETNKRSRDEAFAAQLAANEFERLHSLSAATFPTSNYLRLFDAEARPIEASGTPGPSPTLIPVYELAIEIVTPPAPAPADRIFNAEVRYPANAPNQTKVLFTELMNIPKP